MSSPTYKQVIVDFNDGTCRTFNAGKGECPLVSGITVRYEGVFVIISDQYKATSFPALNVKEVRLIWFKDNY